MVFAWLIALIVFPLWWFWSKPSECSDKHGEFSFSRYFFGTILLTIGIGLFLFLPFKSGLRAGNALADVQRVEALIQIIASFIFIGLGCKIQNRKYVLRGWVDWALWAIWAGVFFSLMT